MVLSARARIDKQTELAYSRYTIDKNLEGKAAVIYSSLDCGYRSPNNICSLHGACSQIPDSSGTYCGDCTSRTSKLQTFLNKPKIPGLPAQLLQPTFRNRIQGLVTDPNIFNCSILVYEGKTLLAYRKSWSKAEVWLAELDSSFNAISNVKLDIPRTKFNQIGSEDPRLFVHNGKLFVSYTGYSSYPRKSLAHMMYSLITPEGKVISTFLPYLSVRNEWEKNWAYFSHANTLFAVHSLNPYTVLEVQDEYAWIHFISDPVFPVSLQDIGSARGGSSPYLYQTPNGQYEWYCFTHNLFMIENDFWYGMSCYTFENKPPFKPVRYLPGHMLLATPKDRPGLSTPHVIFPCGAYVQDGKWTISYGYYDVYCEVAQFDVKELDSKMVSV